MGIERFNGLSEDDAATALRACVRIDSWVAALLASRPYDDAHHLLATARAHAARWTPDEVDAALADHPRIGERPTSNGTTADHSRREQAGVDAADQALADRLADGNRRYEERFDRIYLVRAKGRSGEEMLDLLEQRLGNDDATEREVTRQQLAEIALLRLADFLDLEIDPEIDPEPTTTGGLP
ncbi:2-oxo-4-hydroxy-4-carboxy-5-ureidoimidazoline decarboxylase [Nocardioides caeni]|uniref:2-oxo-4-hydroxy-4-carboxy-5-ureidoimidazoline decarboxylase n=1 Tax=Nocardioides caeni TaxID=574700 RepID=A0A4S8ND75_9ACTN|nr:2-oxo-4-hydroxy-4-carboxy-5-ureidoimidazoline decarboxylase [Nocardioides caeni]THV14530.1 2-oxo-4-hydroxy-4-carboxy-5-ureidoimidazoline decarboxylase [Nocardioides caeni]